MRAEQLIEVEGFPVKFQLTIVVVRHVGRSSLASKCGDSTHARLRDDRTRKCFSERYSIIRYQDFSCGRALTRFSRCDCHRRLADRINLRYLSRDVNGSIFCYR
jgi:hypothetical protein